MKKLFAVLLAVCLLAGCLPLGASAADADWSSAMRAFLFNRAYYVDPNLVSNYRLWGNDTTIRFALRDVDADGQPELLVDNGVSTAAGRATYFYTFTPQGVRYAGAGGILSPADLISSDARYPGVFDYNTRAGTGTAQYYTLGTDRRLVTRNVMADTTDLSTGQVSVDVVDEALYAALQNTAVLDYYTYSQVEAMGWNGFLAAYGISLDSVPLIDETQQRALEDFLGIFAWYGTGAPVLYTSSSPTAGPGEGGWCDNILEGILTSAPCVDYRIYPGGDRQEEWNGRDPQGRWESFSMVSEEKVNWILKNIFGCSDGDVAALKRWTETQQYYYCQDGYYYAYRGGLGGGYYPIVTGLKEKNGRYTVTYDLYDMYHERHGRHYAVMRLVTVGGNEYWALDYCGTKEPDPIPDTPVTPAGFVDVPDGIYYAEPVRWAVEKEITNGMDAAHFDPDRVCTRGQVVTFLWRAAGRPEPASAASPFVDVRDSSLYYYKAVLWAVQNGITTGMDADHFAPDGPCTRGQVVTFLWRAAGRPGAGASASPFLDVADANAYYYLPVLWANAGGVTNGVDANHFAPDQVCTRAHVVTFLYRRMAG